MCGVPFSGSAGPAPGQRSTETRRAWATRCCCSLCRMPKTAIEHLFVLHEHTSVGPTSARSALPPTCVGVIDRGNLLRRAGPERATAHFVGSRSLLRPCHVRSRRATPGGSCPTHLRAAPPRAGESRSVRTSAEAWALPCSLAGRQGGVQLRGQ